MIKVDDKKSHKIKKKQIVLEIDEFQIYKKLDFFSFAMIKAFNSLWQAFIKILIKRFKLKKLYFDWK